MSRLERASATLAVSWQNLMGKITPKTQRRYRQRFYEWAYAYSLDKDKQPVSPGDDYAFFHSTESAMRDRHLLQTLLGVRKVRTLKALAKATGIRHLLNRLNEALSVGLISLAEDGYRLTPKGKHFILNTLKPQKNGKKKRKLVKLRS